MLKGRGKKLTTELQAHRFSLLEALMEEDSPPPPPVPPKDERYYNSKAGSSMEPASSSRPPTAPASSSKRRRDAQDDISYHYATDRLDVDSSNDRPTPSKRSRSHAGASDGDISDTPSQHAAQLRRKGGIRNLSNLNLRHAASTSILPARRESSPQRESRFVEGSLNDKPSQQPPSVFTRPIRTDSGNLQYVEELMADYHEGMPTPARTVQDTIEYEKEMMPERVAEINARSKKEDGMFRFGGKSWGTTFHPIALWNRLWNDTKEELTLENRLEAERKARLKADAEAKYAQMKNAGHFGGSSTAGAQTPQDSAIALDSGTDEHRRTESLDSHARDSQDEQSQGGASIPEPPRTLRGRLSRIHLRRPSMASLTGTVKRTKSEFNLAASHRDASSSLSPSKAEFDGSASILRSSASKYDLKKQNRLSKRVSNLEEKLQLARLELDTALAEASPAPRLTSKFERFTPVNSMKSKMRRPKFVPGALPTLPSERVMFPELRGPETYEETVPRAESEVRTRRPIDLSTAFDDIDDEETVRPRRVSSLQPHAKDIFKDADKSIAETIRSINDERRDADGGAPANELNEANHIGKRTSNDLATSNAETGHATLDAKLKALDASVNAAKKPTKSKKRKSLAAADPSFKPAKGANDDDEELEEAEQTSAKKKKNKSGGKTQSSPPTKKGNHGPKSPQNKLVKKTTTTTKTKKKTDADKNTTEIAMESSQIIEDVEMGDAVGSEDELARPKTADGEDITLEPLYEEEEEMSTMPLNDEPPEPTATATPARYGRDAPRSRSNSPHKRMTRATSRQSRSASPPSKITAIKQIRTDCDTIKVVPGRNGVPDLPEKGRSMVENYEWPDDVF